MKTRLFTRLPGMTLAGLLTLTGVGVLGFGPAAHAEGGGKLEGTWLNEVKIVTCSTGAERRYAPAEATEVIGNIAFEFPSR